MRILLFLMASACLSLNTLGQTKAETFSKIEKVLNKAKGKKVEGLSGEEKIGAQVFTPNSISLTMAGMGEFGSIWMYDHSALDWSAGFEYYLWPVNTNDKLRMLKLEFKNPVSLHQHVKGESGTPRSVSSIELYFLAKDNEKMDELMKEGTRSLK